MTIGYMGTDWRDGQRHAPIQKIDTVNLWPHGLGSDSGGGDKDPLAPGYHAFLAFGPPANRAANTLTGVLSTLTAGTKAAMIIERGFIALGKIASVLTYAGGTPDTFNTSVAIGTPVYIDDSDDLPTDVNLSLSPLNDLDAANPLVGWIFPAQDEYNDTAVGGADGTAYPLTLANELTLFNAYIILK